RLASSGAEVLVCPGSSHAERLQFLLDELGRRRITNVLVEGGGQVLGSLLELGEIDEIHAFVAPKVVGGEGAPGPIAGGGSPALSEALAIEPRVERSGSDIYIHGRVSRR